MYYIYTLSIKHRVFYVGCSLNPVKRYKHHYHDTGSKCFDLVRFWLKEHNTPMIMTIIDIEDNKVHAFHKEHLYIDKFNSIYPLLNNQHYPWLYSRAFVKIEHLKTVDKIKVELQNVQIQIDNYGK